MQNNYFYLGFVFFFSNQKLNMSTKQERLKVYPFLVILGGTQKAFLCHLNLFLP